MDAATHRPDVTLQTAREHGLTDEEYDRLCTRLGRTPTWEELGVATVMWSEHCSYKSSRVHLRRLPTEGERVLQGPGENAGAISIGDGLAVVFKIESHNHPSYIEPYQGAATGVGGILRDVFTMGARPIASLNSLRFGSFDHPKTRYLLGGVVAGIGGYGNSIGVATVGGDVYFDPGYDRNCLVNAFTLGVVEESRLMLARASGVGNPVILIGSRTGRDGIHGASLLASAEFDATSEEKRPTVQVGDPFTEKLLLEATLEIQARDLAVAVQDLGAAGLTSSSVEMASRGGLGIELDLDRVPLRESGMTAYEIMLSESQERMLVVAPPGNVAAIEEICRRWDLEAAVVARLTADGVYRVRHRGVEVIAVPVDLLADPPALTRPIAEPAEGAGGPEFTVDDIAEPRDYQQAFRTLVASPNLCSRRWIWQQYDHYVGAGTVVHPGADAAVVQIVGTESKIAMTVDCNSRFVALDPYVGASIAVCEAARNLIATGAVPLGVSDCLNFGSPERAEVMWQFQQAVNGIRDACLAFHIPVVSGNVSFYNETEGVAIPPTPTIAMVGLVRTPEPITPWFKSPGDAIFLLGRSRDELAGSEFAAVVHGKTHGSPPWVDFDAERQLHQVILRAGEKGILASAHDVSDGGLALAVAEACCSVPTGVPPLGARIRLDEGMRPDAWLFAESQARMLVSVKREHGGALRDIATEAGVPIALVGEVGASMLEFDDLIAIPVGELRALWEGALEQWLEKK
ncbi:MAG TPA: phosphoribosylformylglycinamidine synthase subunit PurL [Candidatus Binatia bacterium]|nr:phosphoribosylformylglycinamidine synthase subunit PurL [Candidatus Binatia bacterium]